MAHVLIIEDNADNLELMSYLLQTFGHTTTSAADGAAGIAMAGQQRPALIVCDIQMQGLDGYAVARALKDDPELAAIPLVAVTALAMVGDRAKILAAGFDSYISKPIDPQRFVADLEALLPAQQRGGGLPGWHVEPERAVAASTGPGGRILVVDDIATNRELMRDTLQPFGYTVLLADSVIAALEIARSESAHLVVSDLHMPEADGFALLRELKNDPVLKTLPFILLSSSSWNGKDRDRAYALGADRFLLRPIEPDRLLAEIEAQLRLPSRALP